MSDIKIPLTTKEADLLRIYFFAVLEANNWVRRATADSLGVCHRTMAHRIRRYRSEGYEIPDSPLFNGRRRETNKERRRAEIERLREGLSWFRREIN